MLKKDTVRISHVLVGIFLLLLSAFYVWKVRPCAICQGNAYEGVCLVDKKTGWVYELVVTDPAFQPSVNLPEVPMPGTFSFLQLGPLTGYRDTAEKSVHLYIPDEPRILKRPIFCETCCGSLADTPQRYALADLRDPTAPKLYSLTRSAAYTIRQYEVTVSATSKNFELTVIQYS